MQSQLQSIQSSEKIQTMYQEILEKVEELYLRFSLKKIRLR